MKRCTTSVPFTSDYILPIMTVNHSTTSNSYLAFFQSVIPDHFYSDTNANIDHVWITLVYPQIEIYDGKKVLKMDCNVAGFSVLEHDYPLMQFLEEFPEFCEKIIQAHSLIQSAYQEFLKQ